VVGIGKTPNNNTSAGRLFMHKQRNTLSKERKYVTNSTMLDNISSNDVVHVNVEIPKDLYNWLEESAEEHWLKSPEEALKAMLGFMKDGTEN
jgi:hypothetical protein